MGYETSQTRLQCGCLKFSKSHDFFNDDPEIWYHYCKTHYQENREQQLEKSKRY